MNQAGSVSLTPEDTDDIWALYNVISVGDEVEAFTLRKIQLENSQGATVDTQKIKLVLAVRVEKLDVDLEAGCLRVNGKNVKENKHVKLGSYHTLELECDRWAKVSKSCWDGLSLQMIAQSTSDSGKYEVAAVVLQEALAHVCVVAAANSVRVLKRVEANLPKKRIGSAYEKAVEKFYQDIIDAVLERFDFSSLKAIVLASPAAFRDDLYKRLMDMAVKDDTKKFIADAKSKFVRCQVSSGQVTALEEALREPRVANLLTDAKTAQEAKFLDQFHRLHHHSPDMVSYSWPSVQKAAHEGAVKVLLLSDALFRSLQVQERKKYVDLVDEVKANGGSVHIFITGTKTEMELSKLSGVAAILLFPVE